MKLSGREAISQLEQRFFIQVILLHEDGKNCSVDEWSVRESPFGSSLAGSDDFLVTFLLIHRRTGYRSMRPRGLYKYLVFYARRGVTVPFKSSGD